MNKPRQKVDPKIALLRRATTNRSDKRNAAGKLKTGKHAPRPITLAKLTFTEPKI